MINPAVVIPSFQRALRQGRLDAQQSPLNPDLWIHQDFAEGVPRVTYVRLERNRTVVALVMFGLADPIDGIPCFDLGYAVPPIYRKKGYGKALVADSILDFRYLVGKSKIEAFFLEAIVGSTNTPSLKIAARVLTPEPTQIIDERANMPASRFLARFTTL